MRAFVKLLVLCCALGLALPAFAEEAPPLDPARIAAARDLLDVTGVTKQMDGMVDAMSRGFASAASKDTSGSGERASALFDGQMKKFLAYKDQMIADFAVLYAETFTADEMKAVADFYRSGVGAKFIALTPELMRKGAAIGMKYSQKIADEMKASPPEQK